MRSALAHGFHKRASIALIALGWWALSTVSRADSFQEDAGAAPFLGITDLGVAGIASVIFNTNNNGKGFAIDTLELNASTSVPEASWGSIVYCLAAGLARRVQRDPSSDSPRKRRR
jgi:hypothetical protein